MFLNISLVTCDDNAKTDKSIAGRFPHGLNIGQCHCALSVPTMIGISIMSDASILTWFHLKSFIVTAKETDNFFNKVRVVNRLSFTSMILSLSPTILHWISCDRSILVLKGNKDERVYISDATEQEKQR